MTTQSSGEMAPRPSIARSDAPLIAHGGSVRLVGQGVRPMALLVLGMHRSGTSALTRVFSLLGAGLPETLIGANSTNPTGHWESDAVRAFNDTALAAAGTEWFDWLPVNEGWARSLAYHGQVDRARDVLRAEFGDAPLFALKDPRICRLAGFWLDVLDAEGIDPAIVMPLRNPLEVAESLSRRDGVDTQIALLVWLRHVLEAERATRGRARMVVSYEQVLDQWAGVADRAARELGVVWPRSALGISEEVEGFLSHDLRHHRRSDRAVVDNPLMSGWVRRTYALLLGWAEGAEKASDYAELDAIRAALDEAGPSFARPLRRIVQQQQQLADLAHQRAVLEGRIETLAGELAQSQQSRQAAADGLADVARAYQAAQARLDEMAADAYRGGEERAALEGELTQLRAQAQFMEQRAQEAQARLAAGEHEAEQLRAALNAQQHRSAELESALIQRQEEIEQAWANLERANAEIGARAEELSQVRALGEILAESVEQERRRNVELSEGLQQAHAHQAAMAGQLEAERAALQEQAATLRGAMEQIGDMAEALTALRGGYADAVEALEQARAGNEALSEEMRERHVAAMRQQAESAREIAALSKLLQDAEGELTQAQQHRIAAETDVTVWEGRLQEVEQARAYMAIRHQEAEQQWGEQARHYERRVGELELSRNAAVEGNMALMAEKTRLEQQLSERFGELASITGLLSSERERAERSSQHLAWLSEVYRMTSRRPWWWAFMPKGWRGRQMAQRLVQAGLFDGDAYLARYPDVLAHGVDPLRHYIQFGMAEGRVRG